MITPERLKELIKQEKVAFDIFKGDIYEVDLKKIKILSNLLNLVAFDYENQLFGNITRDNGNLFETKEEAEWYLEFGDITRIERLSFPSWEDLSLKKEYFKSFRRMFYLVVEMPFNKDVGAIIITQNDLKGNTYIMYDKVATKENYIEACRLCKKLFLGEEV